MRSLDRHNVSRLYKHAFTDPGREVSPLCNTFQSWGGDRIICLGDYADDDDLPEGVTSQDYLDFESGFFKSEEEEEEEWTFARWARTNSERGPKQHKYLEYVRRDLRIGDLLYENNKWEHSKMIPKVVKNDSKVIHSLLNHITDVDERVFVPNMEVLWTHTKNIYIRLSTALDELEDSEVTVPDDYNLLGTLLFIHICWSY